MKKIEEVTNFLLEYKSRVISKNTYDTKEYAKQIDKLYESQPDHPSFEERWLEDEGAAKERNIMIDEKAASKIHDEAREKIARDIYFEGDHFEEGTVANATWRDMPDGMRKNYLRRADQILALSGTTDIECPECKGEGVFSGNYHCSHCGKTFQIAEQAEFLAHQSDCDYVCPKCDNGVIKHKWKIAVVLENGELPESPNTDYIIAQYAGEEATSEDVALMHLNGIEKGKGLMLKAKYRQVVE